MFLPQLIQFQKDEEMHGVLSTRQQDHMVKTITEPIKELREHFPKAGYFELKKHLRIDHKLRVSRHTIKEWSYANEPKSVARQLRKDMVRKVFYCAGVNDLWCLDQHDNGVLKWMKIWWNNSNPVLICKYYLDVIEANRYGLLITQSDIGNENGNVARAQTFLRQWADPELCNTVQHCWMAEKMNIPSEIGLLQYGVNQGWYDPRVPLEVLVFCYIFILWLQHELDEYVIENNTTKKRHNQKIAHPNGIPLLIEQAPERFDTQDYKVNLKVIFFNDIVKVHS
ncbi:hypothetical protein ARMGADRAFT_1046779 [Armillaria gallica]|uniref:Uncharacterized protein n=1 Tax=Armillaria gallica TaxID=47427 RepID=A0A2H3DBL9_ARMGA|nr:hypothetical protein ARMGADRAFT_1046779 [Armillaria gallica]